MELSITANTNLRGSIMNEKEQLRMEYKKKLALATQIFETWVKDSK